MCIVVFTSVATAATATTATTATTDHVPHQPHSSGAMAASPHHHPAAAPPPSTTIILAPSTIPTIGAARTPPVLYRGLHSAARVSLCVWRDHFDLCAVVGRTGGGVRPNIAWDTPHCACSTQYTTYIISCHVHPKLLKWAQLDFKLLNISTKDEKKVLIYPAACPADFCPAIVARVSRTGDLISPHLVKTGVSRGPAI